MKTLILLLAATLTMGNQTPISSSLVVVSPSMSEPELIALGADEDDLAMLERIRMMNAYTGATDTDVETDFPDGIEVLSRGELQAAIVAGNLRISKGE